MDAKEIEELKTLVEHCKRNPSFLHTPSVSFFKNFLQSLGARIPEPGKSGKYEETGRDEKPFASKNPNTSRNGASSEDIVESDVELDDSDVMEPENDPPQKMGDTRVEVTEENQEVAQLSKAKAMDAIADGKYNEAIDHLTESILLNPKSSILYANRASVFVKLKKPSAAIRDANEALQINPDSAKGYKARGMARALLGIWEESVLDLHVASNLDFDEELGAVLKKVEPNVNKIEEHRRKYRRLRKEKELRKIELERQRIRESEAASGLKDGQVIGIPSSSDLENKLNAAKNTSRLAVLYFTATWCGPCRHISPTFTSLAEKYPKVVFLKVDIDKASDAAAKWNVSSVPCFFFIRNGKEVDKVVGADKKTLEMYIAKHAG